MAKLQGSKTELNLLQSFAGESQARNRYTYFSSVAKKEGYVEIASIFEETANQEKEHAKRFFKFLEGGTPSITASFPAGIIGTTEQNLQAAAAGEKEEWSIVYPEFARIAKEESFGEIAVVFQNVAVAEKFHEERYKKFLQDIQEGHVFKKLEKGVWQCMNCGFIYEGIEAPTLCPACAHPQAYFKFILK